MPTVSGNPNTGAPVAHGIGKSAVGLGKGKMANMKSAQVFGRKATGLVIPRKHIGGKKGISSSARAPRPKARKRPGEAAIKKVRHYQKSKDELFIRKLPFQRCAKEVLFSVNTNEKVTPRMEVDAVQFLQEGCESYLIELLTDSQMSACYRKHVTLTAWDMTFTRRMRHEID